jgi:hypothetical protein
MYRDHLTRRPASLRGERRRHPLARHRHHMAPAGMDLDVDADERAVVTVGQRTVAEFGPGLHHVHPDDVAQWTDGDPTTVFTTWFVTTGHLDDTTTTAQVDGTTVLATARLRVTDPGALVQALSPTVDLARPDALRYWLARQLAGAVTATGGTDVDAALGDAVATAGLAVVSVTIPPGGAGTEPVCPHCGGARLASDRFCATCGTALHRTACAGCGAALRDAVRYCTTCGQAQDVVS